jgi:hypothetical protein
MNRALALLLLAHTIVVQAQNVGPLIGLRIPVWDYSQKRYVFLRLNLEHWQIDSDPAGTSDGILSAKPAMPAAVGQPPAMALPAQGEIVYDPTYGTKMIRISGPAQQGITPHCNTWNMGTPFNANSTRLYFACCSGANSCDTATKWFANLGPDGVPTSIINAATVIGYDASYWHPSNPDVFFYVQGSLLRSYDFGAGASTTLKDFGYGIDRLSVSDDANVFVANRRDGGMVAWRKSDNAILFYKTAADPGWRDAKPSGHPNGLYAWTSSWRVAEGDPLQTCLINLTAGTFECHAGSETWMTGHGTLADEYWIHVEGWGNRLIRANVPKWSEYTTLFNSFSTWNREVYVGINGAQTDLVVGVQPGCKWDGKYRAWEHEIFTIPVAGGSPTHRAWNRVDPCNSGGGQDYFHLDRPTYSRDGRFIQFTTPWCPGTSCKDSSNVFILDMGAP